MLEFAHGIDATVRAGLRFRSAADAVLDPRGITVRCTPGRWTVMQTLPRADGGNAIMFRKVRRGGVAAAECEWRWLLALRRCGFSVSEPAFFARAGERTVVATFAAAGRPLPSLLIEAGCDAATAYALAVVVPLVRRLHGMRLVFRDLYWQHWFATSLCTEQEPAWIDVERVLRPALLWRRWVVKDLAGLVSSWPFEPSSFATALVSAYRGSADAALVARVIDKANRIRRRVPKFGA